METSINTRSFNEIKSQIEKIKELNLKSTDFSEVYSKVKNLMNEYTSVQFPAFNNIIYRARPNLKNESGKFKLFEHVEDLWAPRSEYMPVNKFGRANKPGHPVFYCSNSEETAISEVPVQEGSWITIMHCCSKNDLSMMRFVGIGFRDEAVFKSKDGKVSIKWGEYKKEKIKQQYEREYNREDLINKSYFKNSAIDDFLNKEFSKQIDINEYDFECKITASIANLYLDPNPLSINLDGIAYPSIKGQTAAPNGVFTVEAANKFFKPVYFETYEIGKIVREGNNKKYYSNLKFKSCNVKLESEIEWVKE